MATELVLNAVFNSPAYADAIGGLAADAVLRVGSIVAAMSDLAALIELGPSAALFLGLLMMPYGAAALSSKRATLDRVKPYPGVRNVTRTLRTHLRGPVTRSQNCRNSIPTVAWTFRLRQNLEDNSLTFDAFEHPVGYLASSELREAG